MQNTPSPLTLARITKKLIAQDLQNGISSPFYLETFLQYIGYAYRHHFNPKPSHIKNGNYHLHEILNDAWNCKLINNEQFESLENKYLLK